jgi:low-affinity ferrous iron transport protein
MERSIDIYAHVVGSGVGVLLSAIVFAVWIAIGPTLHWSDNWWLVIGTYTGLIGFIDGFVIRNVYFRQSNIVASHLSSLKESDEEIMGLLLLPSSFLSASSSSDDDEEKGGDKKPKLSPAARFSNWMIRICAHPIAVIASVVVVVILIAVATGLRWSETGQLLCNTPTMIVEGFLLLVLFQAHNLVVVERRREVGECLERRRVICGVVKRVKGNGEKEGVVTVEFEVKD